MRPPTTWLTSRKRSRRGGSPVDAASLPRSQPRSQPSPEVLGGQEPRHATPSAATSLPVQTRAPLGFQAYNRDFLQPGPFVDTSHSFGQESSSQRSPPGGHSRSRARCSVSPSPEDVLEMHQERAMRKNAAAQQAMWADELPEEDDVPERRRGKGGRQPAADPRLDPNIDPKKARRILANRLSAARSKMKQKSHVEALRKRVSVLSFHRHEIAAEIASLRAACRDFLAENEHLAGKLEELAVHHNALLDTHAQLVEVRQQVAQDAGMQPPAPPRHPGRDLAADLAALEAARGAAPAPGPRDPPGGRGQRDPLEAALAHARSEQLGGGAGRKPPQGGPLGDTGPGLAELHAAHTFPLARHEAAGGQIAC